MTESKPRARRFQTVHTLSPARIALLYAFSGIGWILFSDPLLGLLVKDRQRYEYFGILKGVLFILVTAFLLYYLASRRALQLSLSRKTFHNAEQRIQKLAYYDSETGLPNFELLQDRLNQALALGNRHKSCTAVVYINLTGFKTVVDACGLSGGIELVRAIAERLVSTLRQYDTVARIHRDEFVVVLGGPVHEEDVPFILRKLQAAFDEPLMLGTDEAIVPACFGVACFPSDGATSELLIQNSHIAMNQALKSGLTYQYYSKELNRKAVERHTIEIGMLRAIDEGEFFLCYQPKMSINGQDVVGMEVLVRWQRPGQGIVLPDRFIPAAEESGLIIRLGAFALREACRQNKAWQDAGLPKLKIAVNLSARQLLDNDFVPLVLRILEETGLSPCYLELELTESALMSNAGDAVLKFLRLKELGIGLTVDDFGTGYSSLSYLKHLPVDTLKIDRSFVRDLSKGPDDAAIVDAIISMAHSLKLNVVAEGVETPEQLVFLQQRNCQQAQGFLFSKPLVPHQFEYFLRTGSTAVAKTGTIALEFSEDFTSFECAWSYQDQPDWNIALHGTLSGESRLADAERCYWTNLGAIRLAMDGDKVSGSYDNGNGSIDGLMRGRKLAGTWAISAETEFVAPTTVADRKGPIRWSTPPNGFQEKVKMVRELANRPVAMPATSEIRAEFISDIAVKQDPVLPGDTIPVALSRFQRDNNLLVLPVVEHGRAVGVVNRSTFLEEHVIGRHGFGIHINYSKKLRDLMLPVELAIEGATPIEEVARLIQATRQNLTRLDNIFVLADGEYHGIVNVNKLFSAITEINLTLAKGANPLTGMPGNESIQREINRRLQNGEGFDIAYLDIDNFKPFNDNYGFQRGDVVIKTIGEIISKTACSSEEASCFCGHIGGDDFIIIAEPNRLEAVSTLIIEALEGHLPLFHGEKDFSAGCYSAQNRKGEQETFGLLSLSISIVNTRLTPVDSYAQLASISTEVKKQAKMQQGSAVVLNRRTMSDSKQKRYNRFQPSESIVNHAGEAHIFT